MKDNKGFCILPFVHTFLDTNGNVKPCCIAGDDLGDQDHNGVIGNLKDNTLEELFNSEKMKQLRLDMLQGKQPTICSTCYSGESTGFYTPRQGNNHKLKDLIQPSLDSVQDDGYIEPKIKSWDIRYSNLCNLKCRSCGDYYSTTWSKENAEYTGSEYKEIKAYEGEHPLDEHFQHVEHIYFAGGEPLIMPEHYETLSKLVEIDRAKDVVLFYNTNMTKLNYNKQYLPDYWNKFKRVDLGLSIDSFGDRANYIRNGAVKWNKIESNIKALSEYENIKYFISPTISVMNVYTITDLHRYFFENNLITDINRILFSILYYPNEYSLSILPKHIKEEIQAKIVKHLEWVKENGGTETTFNQFHSLSEALNADSDPKDVTAFIKKTQSLDQRRNESFPDTFPEYREWWEDITKNTISVVNI